MKRWRCLTTPGNSPPAAFTPQSWTIVVVFVALCACRHPVSWASEIGKEAQHAPSTAVAPAWPHPLLGERLSFHGRWLGIPVGRGWIEVKEIVSLNGRQAYHIEARGHSNDILSTFYPIRDELHSYLDCETLQPLRFEKYQREGRYRADELVTFDYAASTATYRSLLNQSVKEIRLTSDVQDLISALYWFRRQPLQPHTTVSLNLYSDEKLYHTDIQIGEFLMLELLKRGTFPCLVVEPKASFKGLLVKRGRLWAYVTLDERRLPLLVKITTPWGPMSVVLDEASIHGGAVVPMRVQRHKMDSK